jgi:hypothetical protein
MFASSPFEPKSLGAGDNVHLLVVYAVMGGLAPGTALPIG